MGNLNGYVYIEINGFSDYSNLDIKKECRICLHTAVYAKENSQAAKKELTDQRKNTTKADTQQRPFSVNQKEKAHEAMAATLNLRF